MHVMSNNEHNPTSYEIRYKKNFLSYFFGGKIMIECPNIFKLNPEFHDVMPNLVFKSSMGFLEMVDRYECPVKNDKQANEYMIELKLRGYRIITEKVTPRYYD